MFLIYSLYDFVLGEKQIHSRLKDSSENAFYTLRIITPARKFLGLNFGGGMVKVARLYDTNGKLIRPKYYSEEIKEEIKRYKKEFKIPYFQLWKGMLYAIVIILIAAVIYRIRNKAYTNKLNNQSAHVQEQLLHLRKGQLYGVSFFTDKDANGINGLPQGWIRIDKTDGDTVFVQRSKQTLPPHGVFELKNIASVKPQSEDDWESVIEKINYPLLKKQVEMPDKKKFDAMYIGSEHDKYSGVCFTIEGVE